MTRFVAFTSLTRWLLAAVLASALTGCGGGGGSSAPSAPSGLSYPSPATYVVGTAIPTLTPNVSGAVTSFGVSPALPAGLSLNTATGAISGTPTAATASTTYVVTATNSGGSTSVQLTFAVGTVDILSSASIVRTAVATTAVTVDVIIKPRYLTFTGTLASAVNDPQNVFGAPIAVTANSDGSYTLEFATSTTLAANAYTGTVTLALCADSACANHQAVPSIALPYSINVMTSASSWPGDHLSTLAAWAGVADWQTFQGNAAHTGFVPATISPDQLITRWQHSVSPSSYFNGLINLATITTGNGLYYIAGANLLQARRESDASLVWQYDVSGLQYPSTNPPAVANGVVYMAAGQQASASLFAFDAASGTKLFQAGMSSQWENYLAPTIGASGVYTNAGTYGGIYGFTTTGTSLFFDGLDQQSGWTPAVDASTVYAYTGAHLTLIDPVTGLVKGQIVDTSFTNYIYVIGGSTVLGAANSVFAAAYDNSWLNGGGIGNYLVHFNTQALTLDWEVKGDYPHNPAYKNGVLYAVNNSPLQLEARSETDGSLQWTWAPPAAADSSFSSEVLVTSNLLFVSTNSATYAIDLGSHKTVWSYPASGSLALSSNGVLYVEGANTLTAINAK